MKTWSIERTFISAYTYIAVAAQTLIDAMSTLEKVTQPHNDGAEKLSKIEEEEEVWEPSFADAAASLAEMKSDSSVSEDKQETGPQLSGEEVCPSPPAASSPRPGFGFRSADKILVTNVLAWLNEQDNHIDLATWLEPAVITILDEHIPHSAGISMGIACYESPEHCHAIYDDWQAWQEHVTKLICTHIVQALPDYVK